MGSWGSLWRWNKSGILLGYLAMALKRNWEFLLGSKAFWRSGWFSWRSINAMEVNWVFKTLVVSLKKWKSSLKRFSVSTLFYWGGEGSTYFKFLLGLRNYLSREEVNYLVMGSLRSLTIMGSPLFKGWRRDTFSKSWEFQGNPQVKGWLLWVNLLADFGKSTILEMGRFKFEEGPHSWVEWRARIWSWFKVFIF